MIKRILTGFLLASFGLAVSRLAASQGHPTAETAQPESFPLGTVRHEVRIADYGALSGPTTIAFHPTALAAGAKGQAELQPTESAEPAVIIHTIFTNLPPAARLGAEYLTYVLWAVTPEGRTSNLGEIRLAGTEGHTDTKVGALIFGLIVTAEPYFAVSQPSDAVVMEEDITSGGSSAVRTAKAATCELLHRSSGAQAVVAAEPPPAGDPAPPLLLDEARRAVATARQAAAEHYAPDTLGVAVQLLRQAEGEQARGVAIKTVEGTASEAVLLAEDARVLSVTRQARERQAP